MKPGKKPARRLTALGTVGVETVAKARKLQRDVLKRLKRASVSGFVLASLRECTPKHCGKKRCRAVCAFGARSHRLKAIPAVYRLLEKHDGPLFEVRVSRAVWCRPLGELNKVSLVAATKLVRRALDTLYDTDIVAVGSLKATVVTGTIGLWRIEAHQIVAGVTREDLYQIFSTRRDNPDNFILIDAVTNLGDAVSRVLRHDLHLWQHPTDTREPTRPKRSARAEYYGWLLRMNSGALTIRYGCDRHFNALQKEPRTIKPKPPKKRRSSPVA